ncbi:hypothetical protein JCM8202_000438 [Rhodotorula sphaerocarpa]
MATPDSAPAVSTSPPPRGAASPANANAPANPQEGAAARRVIPGLTTTQAQQQQAKQRKRSQKKSQSAGAGAGAGGATSPTGDQGVVHEHDAEQQPAVTTSATGQGHDEPGSEQGGGGGGGKPSAAEVVQKRLRATTKKIQRIESYEQKQSTEGLNPDQLRAVQGKPALQAVVRELSELLALLKADEAEEAERQVRVRAAHEKQQSRAVEAAVHLAQKEAQSKLVFLFQFLHLHSLVNPQQQLRMGGFAPAPELPPILEQATAQQIACVRYLADAFANGPLLGGRPGGDDDATEKLARLFEGAEDEVLPGQGVSYGQVSALVHGLTAPPPPPPGTQSPAADRSGAAPGGALPTFAGGLDLGDDIGASASVPGTPRADSLDDDERERAAAAEDVPAGPADSVVALVDGALEPEPHPVLQQQQQQPPLSPQGQQPSGAVPTMSFLQPDEVEAARGGGRMNGGMRLDLSGAQGMSPRPAAAGASPQQQQGSETPRAEEKVQSWADELAQDGQLPPPPEEAPTPLLTPTLAAAPPAEFGGGGGGNGFAAPAPKLDWAAEDDDDLGGLPSLPELAPPVPIASDAPASTRGQRPAQQRQQQQQPGTPFTGSEGFQPARPSRRGSSDRGGSGMSSRGSFRGGRGGRTHSGGSGFGPGGSGGSGPNGNRPPRGPQQQQQQSGAAPGEGPLGRPNRGGRGGGGGGGGGGRGRGRGEGRPNGREGGGAARGSYSTPVAPDAKA